MKQFRMLSLAFVAITVMVLSSCEKDPVPQTKSTNYPFNTGQLGAGTAYSGTHGAITATVKLTENGNQTTITVTLVGTQNGLDYNIHVHDAADPTTTPNNTPYNEAPNASILVMTIAGNGGTVSKDYTSTMSYNDLVNNYAGGFFVVHDPTQAISTTNLQTYLIVGTFEQ
jgi:hypothetical protein